jgi:hypothetical protein
MKEILIGKIQWPFLAQFLPTSLLDVPAVTRAQNSGGYNSRSKKKIIILNYCEGLST